MQKHEKLSGEDLKHEICRVLDLMGVSYETERYSDHKSSIIGKGRRVDVAILDDSDDVVMHIECKNQNVSGSTEDKLFRAVEEANRDKRLGTPSIIVFSGFGWSPADMRHAMLNGAVRIELLEDWLRIYFQYQKIKPDSIFSD